MIIKYMNRKKQKINLKKIDINNYNNISKI